MTPKEKAQELINKFIRLTSKHEKLETAGLGAITLAKKCALIAVNEIMNVLTVLPYGIEYLSKIDFYEGVKQEIEKL